MSMEKETSPCELLIKEVNRLALISIEEVNKALASLVKDHLDDLKKDFKNFLKENKDRWEVKPEVKCDLPEDEDSTVITIGNKYFVTNLLELFNEYAAKFNFNVAETDEMKELCSRIPKEKFYKVAMFLFGFIIEHNGFKGVLAIQFFNAFSKNFQKDFKEQYPSIRQSIKLDDDDDDYDDDDDDDDD